MLLSISLWLEVMKETIFVAVYSFIYLGFIVIILIRFSFDSSVIKEEVGLVLIFDRTWLLVITMWVGILKVIVF